MFPTQKYDPDGLIWRFDPPEKVLREYLNEAALFDSRQDNTVCTVCENTEGEVRVNPEVLDMDRQWEPMLACDRCFYDTWESV